MLRRTFNLHKEKKQLCPESFLRQLSTRGYTSFFGVPDSLLKELCKCITHYGSSAAKKKTTTTTITNAIHIDHHVIAANEGNAIGLAAGYHLASAGSPSSPPPPSLSSSFPVVYMQNSGLGNCVNPLTSLTHSEVYSMPMLLLVGWRGMPGSKADEPQHVAMGRLTTNILDACEVPHALLPKDEAAAIKAIETATAHLREKKTPYALLVDRDTFSAPPNFFDDGAEEGKEEKKKSGATAAMMAAASAPLELTREGAIEEILKALPSSFPVVGNTGMISREIFETRKRLGQSNASDFLTVGAMGHASSIAAGIVLGQHSNTQKDGAAAVAASNQEDAPVIRRTICLDGDGAFIMHMGAAAVLGGGGGGHFEAASVVAGSDGSGSSSSSGGVDTLPLGELVHIVLNNGAHDSVGGQPTVGFDVDLTAVAIACGYGLVARRPVRTMEQLKQALLRITSSRDRSAVGQPQFLEVCVKKGNRKDLGRPTSSAADNKAAFVEFLASKPQAEAKSHKDATDEPLSSRIRGLSPCTSSSCC